jgi:hypothetical protein
MIAAWFHSKSEEDIRCVCLRWLSRLREWTIGRPRRRWVDNIKMDLREIGWDGRDWIELAQDSFQSVVLSSNQWPNKCVPFNNVPRPSFHVCSGLSSTSNRTVHAGSCLLGTQLHTVKVYLVPIRQDLRRATDVQTYTAEYSKPSLIRLQLIWIEIYKKSSFWVHTLKDTRHCGRQMSPLSLQTKLESCFKPTSLLSNTSKTSQSSTDELNAFFLFIYFEWKV